MSIIHDALKKVQQGLNMKTNDEPQAPPPQPAPDPSAYIYDTPPAPETPAQPGPKPPDQKSDIRNEIKASLALACAIVITVGSAVYILQQFRNDIPKVQRLAKKSFLHLIHKKGAAAQAPAPVKLGALAQLTINPSTANSIKPAPVTLDIHGIMSNANGNLVLINDQVYQEGDVVDGAKIVKINLDSITINNNGVEKTIFVKD